MKKAFILFIFTMITSSFVFCDYICLVDNNGDVLFTNVENGNKKSFSIESRIYGPEDVCIFGERLAVVNKDRGLLYILNPHLNPPIEKTLRLPGDRVSGIISINNKLFISRVKDVVVVDNNLELLKNEIQIGARIPIITGGPRSLMYAFGKILGVIRYNGLPNPGEFISLIDTNNLKIIVNRRTLTNFRIPGPTAMALGNSTLATHYSNDEAAITTNLLSDPLKQRTMTIRGLKAEIAYSNKYFAFLSTSTDDITVVNERNSKEMFSFGINYFSLDDTLIPMGNYFICVDHRRGGFFIDTTNLKNDNEINFSQNNPITIIGCGKNKVFFTKRESKEKTVFAISPATFNPTMPLEEVVKINPSFSFDFSFYLATK